MKPSHLLLIVVVMAVWGGNFVVIKMAVAELPPMLFMTVRYVATVLLLAPFMARETSRLAGLFGLSVTLGFLHFALAFTGLVAIDASVAAVLQQTQVPFAALLAAVVLGERIGWWRAVFMAVSFAGVVILAGEPRTASEPAAVALVIAGALMWAVASLQAKRLGPIDPFAINGWIAAFAAPQMLAASLVFETGHAEALANVGWRTGFAVAYMVLLVTTFGYGVWYWLLQRHEVNAVMPLTLLMPVFAFAFGVLFLGDPVGPERLLGAGIILAGVAGIVLRPIRRRA